MSDSTLTFSIAPITAGANASSVTLTLNTASLKEAQQTVQNITRNGGVWITPSSGGNPIYYPLNAILQITIS